MPTCPNCKNRFKTLEDEQDMHDCPKCGFSPGDLVGECEDEDEL